MSPTRLDSWVSLAFTVAKMCIWSCFVNSYLQFFVGFITLYELIGQDFASFVVLLFC